MKKTAIILGATGLTGGYLLQLLLEDDSYERIKLFSRKPYGDSFGQSGGPHPKIEEYIIDLLKLEDHIEDYQADEVFCCIGTTQARTPNRELYRKIDYGIPVMAARLGAEKSIKRFLVISAMGANAESRVFYNRTKGEMERDVLATRVPEIFIFRPSLIGGKRNERRIGESMGKVFMRLFGFLVPAAYKMIHPQTIAKAMQMVAQSGYHKTVIASNEIRQIADQ